MLQIAAVGRRSLWRSMCGTNSERCVKPDAADRRGPADRLSAGPGYIFGYGVVTASRSPSDDVRPVVS